ncbi:MAG: ABC transporter ATP-binding protein, partial [Fimbriimonadaceae bacterium]|nr:ABC transporter ATP-binding protein [Fimbriimonadaceae bacterium]
SDVCEHCVSRGKTLLRLFGFTKPYKIRLLWGTFLILAGTVVELIPPYLSKLLVDDVLTGEQVWMFGWLIGGLVVSRFVLSLIQMARGRNVALLGRNIAIDIRGALFRKLQQLSLGFYDKRSVGSLMSRVTNDTGALYDVLIDGVPITINQGAMLIGIPIVMLIMDWKVAIWVLAPMPLILIAVHIFRKKMERVWSRFWHNWSRLSGSLNGVLQGMRVVKAFHGESREVTRFDKRITDVAQTGYQAEVSWSTLFPVVMFTMGLSTVMIWWVGGQAVLRGETTIGDLTAFVGYALMLNHPLMMLQRIIDWTSRSLTAAERVFEVLDTPLDVPDSPDAVAMPRIEGNVTFEDVRFGYEKSREIVKGISLEVAAGEMIGLVGHSGAGKSTLINLLMRFYDPTDGRILVDGVDLKQIKVDDFRRQVGVVMQESYLFPGTVGQNIAYGRPDATLEEVIAAAKAANAHDFIVNFPDGYDAYVGERGQRLSGGERQRIAIARAILHNPRILILDEATASVDTETERMIQEALERLIEGRTVFAIAHRLSTLRSADRLVVLDQGKVAEIGTHDELLKRENGIFAKLVTMQTEINKVRENYIVED